MPAPQVGTPATLTPAVEFGTVPAQTLATAAFTIPPNTEVVVHACGRDTAAPTNITISDNQGGAITWTQIQNGAFNATNRMAVFRAEVGSAGLTGVVVTVGFAATIAGGTLAVFGAAGVNLAAPIANATGTTGTSTTPNVGTVAAMATGNCQILLTAERGPNTAPEAGWTELYDINSSTGNCNIAGYYNLTGDTTPTATITSAPWRAAYLELAAGAVAGSGALAASARSGRRSAAIRRAMGVGAF